MRHNLQLPIAGLSHRCTERDNGTYTGYTKAEPNNVYDADAIAIYDDNGRHYGYIPRELTSAVRVWGKGRTDFKCVFNIDIDNDRYSNNYYGSVELKDNSYAPLPICSKYFYFGKSNTKSDINMKDFCIQSVNSSAKIIDYVVTDEPESLPKGITKRILPVISYQDFYKMLHDEIEPNEYKGKNICIVFKSDQLIHQIVRKYLIECGANVTDRYSKKNTDIVIDRQEYGLLKATLQAKEDGKTIYMINEVIRKLGYDIKDKPKQEIPQRVSSSKPTYVNNSTPNYSIQQNSNSGCIIWFIICIVSLATIILL